MDRLCGMNREQLLRRASNTDQVFGVCRLLCDDGKSRGTAFYDVRTGAGLRYQVLADNGLDIGALTYKGVNISYLGKPGQISPFSFVPDENEFGYLFAGGMLFTCGLMNTGPANQDGGDWMPEHGRYHFLPASQIAAQVSSDTGQIEVSGQVTQGQLFAHQLEMRRRVLSPVGENALTIEDTLYNCSPEPVEYMLLYHCNFGWPFLSEDLRLRLPASWRVTPANPESAGEEIELACTFSAPVDGYAERVFFYDVESGAQLAAISVENPALGIGVTMEWTADTLPHLIEWKSMRSTDYVLGLEPSTNHVVGRNKARESGTLLRIPPFGSTKMRLRLGFYDM